MSEEKDVTPVAPDQVQQAFQKYADKCFELGNAVYKNNKINKDFDIYENNCLVDIDKLAKDHDKILAERNNKEAQAKLNEKPAEVAT